MSTTTIKDPNTIPPRGHKHQTANPKCTIHTFKLGVCANLLNDLVHFVIGTPQKKTLLFIENLVYLEAIVCLYTIVKADVLGINLSVQV
ncbi:hypothetical protein GIB67_019724 [Kingdonia uniflora]|uniref:Hydrophobic seed protein domain-containing protein n=1 Tax=Kingdonia uniflora TaxID=39325 RepID=A0A7J7MKD6_9MAGN|nr:hypothetical protein GIB67_019724 [Kingdonia uniflora]